MNEAKRVSKQVATGVCIVVIALAIVVGAPRSRRPGPVRPASTPETVRLPDLTDPAVRKWFADSFENGYFTTEQPRRSSSRTPGVAPICTPN